MKARGDLLDRAPRCIASRTRQLARLVTRHYENALRETGLTVPQFNLMAAIGKAQQIAPVSLARMFDLEKSSLSRNLRGLIDSKLVSTEAAGGGQSLRLTRKGKEALDRALPAWSNAQTQAISVLGGDVISKLDEMIAEVSTLA